MLDLAAPKAAAPSQQAAPCTIALVGLMGAGKSCIGRLLAAHYHLPFVDADAEIEAAAGCSISEIFEKHGEPYFREGERRVIARLVNGPPIVLATGGGAFMNAETRALIKERAISVWLRASLDVLVRRTARRTHRPLLKGGEPREILANLIALRYPIYAEADAAVDSEDVPSDATAQRAVAAIEAVRAARGAVPTGKPGQAAASQ
ncbi:MAG: shikimate kinase [Alphaproteobacteria bacterium]|nr:shikimate kinase [Alphaproteobacteria bacterium]